MKFKLTKIKKNPKLLWTIILAIYLLSGRSINAQLKFGNFDEKPSYLRNEGLKSYFKGDLDTAFTYFQRAIKQSIKDFGENSIYTADLYFELAELALKSGKFQSAENNLKNAAEINPNSITYHLKLAKVLQLRHKPEQAFQEISLALAKNKSSLEAHAAMINFLTEQGMSVTANQESIVYNYLKTKNSDENILLGALVPANAPNNNSLKSKESITSPSNDSNKAKASNAKPITKSIANQNETKAKVQPLVKPVEKPKSDAPKQNTTDKLIKSAKTIKSNNQLAKTNIKTKPKSLKTKSGLVPPPPPTIPSVPPTTPIVPAPSQNIKLDTKVKIKPLTDNNKTSPETKPVKTTAPKPTTTEPSNENKSGDEADFMLEWGSVKKKH